VNNPQAADVIVVLAGETNYRPLRGLELLRSGYARRMILDVPAQTRIYQWSQLDLAEQYVRGLPEASAINVCPVYGLSTRSETQDVQRCLGAFSVKRILLVTSDYHTRRALSTFRTVLPGYQFEVAAAFSPETFGTDWWKHREWAKTLVGEWTKLLWWESVDRWRKA
jgi:uncharacterized SAM-binding protein YcdF (DUF218 family)